MTPAEPDDDRDLPRKIHGKVLEYENPYQKIYRVRVDFEAHHKDIFVNELGPRVGVVVARGDDILLVRQYRLLIDGMSLELPGGGVASGESPAAAATRECREETGIACRELKPLLFFQPGLDTTDNPGYLFSCESFEETASGTTDKREVVDCQWISLAECLERVFDGRISDSLTICGILAFEARRRRDDLRAIRPPFVGD